MSDRAAAKTQDQDKAERIAKVIARAGVCSRREAEMLIGEGRVAVNGAVLASPAFTVTPADAVTVDGAPLAARERTRLWLFNKRRGLVTSNRDPQGRTTIFSALPADLPRVVTIGRLDINTEGLLLLTNDGGLARILELPATGWLRRYRVRVHGRVTQADLDRLARGVTVDGMVYGAVEANLDREQGANCWLTMGLREGKNREVKKILEYLGLTVTRLIRVSYGPFQLGAARLAGRSTGEGGGLIWGVRGWPFRIETANPPPLRNCRILLRTLLPRSHGLLTTFLRLSCGLRTAVLFALRKRQSSHYGGAQNFVNPILITAFASG